ncbi:MAG: DNA mismatch repair protein MutS, partial [Bacteroidetes bacterium]|nr:DNA mismatch repair protein MutS [Bacteroidota bacterium]
MIRIDSKTLLDLEFPSVLAQISTVAITDLGKQRIADISPFSSEKNITPELHRVKEFTASFESDNVIPNHGFEAISKELQMLGIENSTLEVSGFR